VGREPRGSRTPVRTRSGRGSQRQTQPQVTAAAPGRVMAARAAAAAAVAHAELRLDLHARLASRAQQQQSAGAISAEQRVQLQQGVGSIAGGGLTSSRSARDQLQHGVTAADEGDSEQAVDWGPVLARVCERGETECAMCLCPLAREEGCGVAVLSCSHVLHADCIGSFEAFQGGRRGTGRCPMCRGAYVRRCFAAGPPAAT
jgi:hypothetical protein